MDQSSRWETSSHKLISYTGAGWKPVIKNLLFIVYYPSLPCSTEVTREYTPQWEISPIAVSSSGAAGWGKGLRCLCGAGTAGAVGAPGTSTSSRKQTSMCGPSPTTRYCTVCRSGIKQHTPHQSTSNWQLSEMCTSNKYVVSTTSVVQG